MDFENIPDLGVFDQEERRKICELLSDELSIPMLVFFSFFAR